MNNLPLQPLKWVDHTTVDYIDHRAQGAGVSYRACYFADKFRVYWVDSMGGSDGNKEFDSLDELKHWVNTDHYPHKMQPYVKPAPTWIDASERLPEMYKRVLIKADCYLVAGREPKSENNKDWGITGEWMWSIVNDNWCDAHMVTHWMPIPEFSTMKNNKGE